jgi:hypothetical protein
MRIISLMSVVVAAAAVLTVGAVVEAPHATRSTTVVSAAAATATPTPTATSSASGDGNDPWD